VPNLNEEKHNVKLLFEVYLEKKRAWWWLMLSTRMVCALWNIINETSCKVILVEVGNTTNQWNNP